jgi:hypothetical protein
MQQLGPPRLVLIDCTALRSQSPHPPTGMPRVRHLPRDISAHRRGRVSGYQNCMADDDAPTSGQSAGAPVGRAWDSKDLFFLKSALARGMALTDVAGFLGRTEHDVQAKAEELTR